MDIKDEVDKAVDNLFGKYTVKSKEIAKEAKEIPLVQDKQHKTPALGKNEVEQIKALTASMLKLLSLAVKADSWGLRLYYSHQFLQIAMSVSKLVTVRK